MTHNQKNEITCITCPIGCRILYETKNGNYVFSGNQCKKGLEFAKTELTAPVRSLTTTVRTIFPGIPVIPVKTSTGVPKEKIFAIINELSKMELTERIGIGETAALNIAGTGCDIIVTSNLLKEI